MQHIIKQQIIDLTFREKDRAFYVQQKISDRYKNEIVPVIEKVFNELSDDEYTIQIDQIELDLGEISEKEMNENHWNEWILPKIRKVLIRLISREKEIAKKDGNLQNSSAFDNWLVYLQKGYLPWNLLEINETFLKEVLQTLAVDYKSAAYLKEEILKNAFIAKRIVSQYSQDFLKDLLSVLTAAKQDQLAEILRQVSRFISLATKEHAAVLPDTYSVEDVWIQAIYFAAGKGKQLTPSFIAEKILEGYPIDKKTLIEIILKHSDQLQLIKPQIDTIIAKENFQPSREKENDSQTINRKKEEKFQEEISEINEEGVFVQNAGLVLVHAFLPSLFKRLEWVVKGKFTAKDVHQKAVYLLHYLATRNTIAEEYELVVAKILCNWSLRLPVEKNVELNERELSEADNMLQGLIEQWEVLKNTTPDGLREGFFKRRGKYFVQNEKNYLRVENGSIDILLDHLTWNLNLIKLPWMTEILWVEWR